MVDRMNPSDNPGPLPETLLDRDGNPKRPILLHPNPDECAKNLLKAGLEEGVSAFVFNGELMIASRVNRGLTIKAATPAGIGTALGQRLQPYRHQTGRGEIKAEDCRISDPVLRDLIQQSYHYLFPQVKRFTMTPVLHGGKWITRAGLHAPSQTVLLFDHPEVETEIQPSARAAAELRELISDLLEPFQFSNRLDGEAFFVAALTGMLVDGGPSPIFFVGAEEAECGKTLLPDLVGIVATGEGDAGADRDLPKINLHDDCRQMENQFGIGLRPNAPGMVIDNIQTGKTLLNPIVDMWVTIPRPAIRAFGVSENIPIPDPKPILFANGNRLQLGKETDSRAICINLGSPFPRLGYCIREKADRSRAAILKAFAEAWTYHQSIPEADRPKADRTRLFKFQAVTDFVLWVMDGHDIVKSTAAGKVETDSEKYGELAAAWLDLIGTTYRHRVRASQLWDKASGTKSKPLKDALTTALNGYWGNGRDAATAISSLMREIAGKTVILGDGKRLRFMAARNTERMRGLIYWLEEVSEVGEVVGQVGGTGGGAENPCISSLLPLQPPTPPTKKGIRDIGKKQKPIALEAETPGRGRVWGVPDVTPCPDGSYLPPTPTHHIAPTPAVASPSATPQATPRGGAKPSRIGSSEAQRKWVGDFLKQQPGQAATAASIASHLGGKAAEPMVAGMVQSGALVLTGEGLLRLRD